MTIQIKYLSLCHHNSIKLIAPAGIYKQLKITIMTTQEFNVLLENANTVKEIAELRNQVSASKYVSECKMKIAKVAKNEGYSKMSVSMNVLSKLTYNTNCGSFFEFDVPKNNRTFSAYKKVSGYVNAKTTGRYQDAEIYLKETK